MLERVPRGVPLPGEDAVEDEEAGDAGGVEARVLATRHRQPVQLDGEEVLEQEGEEEDRHGDADERADHREVVEPRGPPAGGHVAQRDAERDRRGASRRTLSSTVAGNRWRKIWKASTPGSTPVLEPELALDGPLRRTPSTARRAAGRGPRAFSRAARRSGVAFSPRIAETVPPGRLRSHRKTSSDRTTTTPTICSSLRRMNLSTVAQSPSLATVGRRVDHARRRTVVGSTRLWPPQRVCWDGHSRRKCCPRSASGHLLTVTEENVSAVSGLATRPLTLPLTTRAGGEWLIARPGRSCSMICWLSFS